MSVLKNVELMWACLTEINEYSQKYEVTMANLNEEQTKYLKDLGATVTKCDREGEKNRGNFARCKTKFEPVVFLGKKRYSGEVGNGSVGNVAFGANTYMGKTGLQLNKLVVTKLVEYEGGAGGDEDDDDLFAGVEDTLMDDAELTV